MNPELRRVLFAEDRDTLLEWLRGQELLHHDPELGFTMVHAGLAPYWTLSQAERAAREVERYLRGPNRDRLLLRMFGNRPTKWSRRLQGLDRLRAAINVMTRMRFCDVHGHVDFDAKGAPGEQKPGLYPWFEVPGRQKRDTRIVFGHWSALGRLAGLGVYALDTGCVWGGELTALQLDAPGEPRFVAVPAGPNRTRT